MLREKADDIPELRARYVEARQEHEEALKAQDLRSKQERVRTEKAWAHVAEKEKVLIKLYMQQSQA